MPICAVFLDRDGTIIREAEYLADPAGVELLPGAAAGICRLRDAGFLVMVTSNQSGVGRGFFDETTVKKVNARMEALLLEQGAKLDGIYYCPHYAKGSVPEYAIACDCRKPAPGMLLTAAQEHDVDLKQSWVVGDKAIDVEFGRKQGLRTILVLTGYGEKTRAAGFKPGEEPDAIARNLDEAAQVVLSPGTVSKP